MTATSSPRSVVFLQPRQLRAAVQVITSLAVNYLRKLVLYTPNLRPLKCNPVSPSLFLRFCSREVVERYLFESNFHVARRHLPLATNTKCYVKSHLLVQRTFLQDTPALGQSGDEGEFKKIFKLLI